MHNTVVGRCIGVLVCIVGIFLFSLITMTLMIVLTLDGGDEHKVFLKCLKFNLRLKK